MQARRIFSWLARNHRQTLEDVAAGLLCVTAPCHQLILAVNKSDGRIGQVLADYINVQVNDLPVKQARLLFLHEVLTFVTRHLLF